MCGRECLRFGRQLGGSDTTERSSIVSIPRDNKSAICCLELDMVVRDDYGNILDINQTSTTQLYEHHVRATNRIRRATVREDISEEKLRNLIGFGSTV